MQREVYEPLQNIQHQGNYRLFFRALRIKKSEKFIYEFFVQALTSKKKKNEWWQDPNNTLRINKPLPCLYRKQLRTSKHVEWITFVVAM
jgi:hypothetical protein